MAAAAVRVRQKAKQAMTAHAQRLAALILLSAVRAFGGGPPHPADGPIGEIDGLFEAGMRENWRAEGLALLAQSQSLCLRALERDPESYELLWRCARCAVEYAETAKILERPDWRRVCGDSGRKAIAWTDRAKKASPDRVEGHYWQLQAMGLIFESGDLFTVLVMGLAEKGRQNLEASYRIDRSYLDYTPVMARAMYYYSLPPLLGQDLPRALGCLEEFSALSGWSFEPYRKYPSAAALLLASGTDSGKARAAELLHAALADPTPRPYYRREALSLLGSIAGAPR